MVGISRRPRCQSRSPRRRQNGRPHHPALGAPRLLQSQDLGLGRLSRPAPQAPPDLSRRVRLPLQPPPYPACRIPFLARHRRSPPAPDLQHVGLTGSKGISLLPNTFCDARKRLVLIWPGRDGLRVLGRCLNLSKRRKIPHTATQYYRHHFCLLLIVKLECPFHFDIITVTGIH